MTEPLTPSERKIARRIQEAERRARRAAIMAAHLEIRAVEAKVDVLQRWAAGLSFDPTGDWEVRITAAMAARAHADAIGDTEPDDPASRKKECDQ
jgi:hypothetical protein